MSDEIQLPEGRLTRGVVRVGDTVRRPRKPGSPFVARLLGMLEADGHDWLPRYLGVDETGRDTLSYIEGEVEPKWRTFADAQLCSAAHILRALHAATRGSALAADHSVVCHHDPGPNNFIFRAGAPVALIDFDMAAPGEPLEDLGYMAWAWCVSSKPARQPIAAQAKQVRTLADAYGLVASERGQLLAAMLERQSRNISFWQRQLASGEDIPCTPETMLEVIAWSRRELAYTREHESVFLAALG